MNDDIILQITGRIKELRKEQKITLSDIAGKAGVTKGLISQIENNRTVPSLPVLLNIIKSLSINPGNFFESITNTKADEPLLITSDKYKPVKKEHIKGCDYKRLAGFSVNDKLVDIVLYTQDKTAKRKPVATDAHEFNYMLKGKMEYVIEGKSYVLKSGDSFYYNAKKLHVSKCLSDEPFVMLVVYFFS